MADGDLTDCVDWCVVCAAAGLSTPATEEACSHHGGLLDPRDEQGRRITWGLCAECAAIRCTSCEALKEAFARLLELDDPLLYCEVGAVGGLIDLTTAGTALANDVGLTVDYDGYGCAFVPEVVAELDRLREISAELAAGREV